MIFSPELCAKVMDGTKTVTRRPAKIDLRVRSVKTYLPCRYQFEKEYAVQPGRGKHQVGRIKIVSIGGPWLVHSITEADAILEGFASKAEFLDRWMELYGSVPRRCWRIEFERLTNVAVRSRR